MICFAWWQLPQYGARCIGAFVKSTKERVVVVATRPRVPIRGMEDALGCEINWIEESDSRPLDDVCGEIPRVVIVSGWALPIFVRYAAEVRKKQGRAIAMVDNNYELSFREIARAIRFRIMCRKRYDGFLVPGRSGRRLMHFYGVPDYKIGDGLYAADAKLFNAGSVNMLDRSKTVIFVGQFSVRKNVIPLCHAFAAAHGYERGWKLALYGGGELMEQIPNLPGIQINGFLQPQELAEKYRGCRAFCLPSLEEHWGLVVHEAALSGCLLMLSTKIGAAEDLLDEGVNGFSFSPFSIKSMRIAFEKLFAMPENRFVEASDVSIKLAKKNASLSRFVKGVTGLISNGE